MLHNGTSVGSKHKLKPPYLPSTMSRLRWHVLDRTRIKADEERNIGYHEKTKLGDSKSLRDLTESEYREVNPKFIK